MRSQDEAFLEDVNMILNTGDVPNLYEHDEKAEIIEKVRKSISELRGLKVCIEALIDESLFSIVFVMETVSSVTSCSSNSNDNILFHSSL